MHEPRPLLRNQRFSRMVAIEIGGEFPDPARSRRSLGSMDIYFHKGLFTNPELCSHSVFWTKTGCLDCYYVMTNGYGLNRCSKGKQEIAAEPVLTIDSLLKRCCGSRALAFLGEIFHPSLVRGIVSSGASRAGLTKASGRRYLLRCQRMPISKKCSLIVRSSVHTSTLPALQKKGTTRYWPFSWGIEYQDSRCRGWLGQPGTISSHRWRTT